MAIALFTLMVFIVLAATSSLIASSDVRATRDARGGSQAHFAAEAAISEALQRVNGPGVSNFQNDVVGQWAATWGAGTHSFGPVSGYTYTVTPVASATNPANAGQLIATADGREGVHNVVVANVVRSNLPLRAPGVIYLANNQATNATFKGDSFSIDGNDHNYTGGAGSAPPVPGLSTRNDANRQEAVASLDAGQKDNIRGLGFSISPLTPSIMTSPAAPSIAQMNQIIDDLLALGPPIVVPYSDNQINGKADFGTTGAPQITHFTNTDGVTIKANGNASGAGIMIVEGDLTIQGDLNFKGLILVRGTTSVQLTDVTGNATIYGSLWTQDVDLNVGGSAVLNYSTQALALANQVGGTHPLPSPLKVLSLADCGMMPSGVGGCP
ncbi:MAG: hypothetical protein E6J60_10845 [Deltaproteobacteria bacterium]|nr:MAG: hypothetical protein E6J60_10845 [Deltaproteobacteria bacterium]